MKITRWFVVILMIALAIMCVSDVGATIVHISNGSFIPSVVVVLPGTGVTWVNDDSVVHSVVTVNENQLTFDSGNITGGGRWDYTFGRNEGAFKYIDGFNTGVAGTIVVKNNNVVYLVDAPSATRVITPVQTSTPVYQEVVVKPNVTIMVPTHKPTKTIVVTEVITIAPTLILTPKPTVTVNYSATIAAMQSQIAEQNVKIEEQGGWIEKILKFLRLA